MCVFRNLNPLLHPSPCNSCKDHKLTPTLLFVRNKAIGRVNQAAAGKV